MIIKQDSRMLQHTLTTPGVPFTAGPGTDFTNGTWVPSDLALSEFGVQEGDGKLFVNIGGTIVQIKTGTSEDEPFDQVNSDWNATTGVAAILNKPTIPTAVSELTNDSNYLTSIYGLLDVGEGLGLSGGGAPGSPFILTAAETNARRFDNTALTINETVPAGDPSKAIFTVNHSDSGSFETTKMVTGHVMVRDNTNNNSYVLTVKAVQTLIDGAIIIKVNHITSGDINVTDNPISIYASVGSLTGYYYLSTSTGVMQVDVTSIITVTTTY